MAERDELTGVIVDASYRLHSRIGPGLMENVYEPLLARMLAERGLRVEKQKTVSIEIDGVRFAEGFRLDLLVNERVVVELKAIDKLAPVHSRQLLSYLRLMDLSVGLLINFGELRLKDGIHRVVNGYRPDE